MSANSEFQVGREVCFNAQYLDRTETHGSAEGDAIGEILDLYWSGGFLMVVVDWKHYADVLGHTHDASHLKVCEDKQALIDYQRKLARRFC